MLLRLSGSSADQWGSGGGDGVCVGGGGGGERYKYFQNVRKTSFCADLFEIE